MRRIMHLSSETFELKQILQTAAQEIGKFFDVDRCTVIRFQEENNLLKLDLAGVYQRTEEIPKMNLNDPDIREVVQCVKKLTRQQVDDPAGTMMIPDQEAYMAYIKQRLHEMDLPEALYETMERVVERYQSKSTLRTNIYHHGVPYGSLTLQTCFNNRDWQEEEARFLEDLARQLGIALSQAELYQKEQKARNEAERANKKKSQFLANMSHELRTPLNAVIGYSAMMKEGMTGELTDKQYKFARNIEISGKHLLDMVNDILDISRIEAGKIQLSLQTVNLKSMMKDLEDILSGMAEQKKVDLEFYIQSDLDTTIADPIRLRQIFFNLISNAIKFNKEGGKVDVRLSREGEWMIGEVEDTGIGIPQDKQGELFSEFFQVDDSMSRSHEGTGLGLALTRRIVELHGGNISFESHVGTGSTFTFRLPISSLLITETIDVSEEVTH